jgi:hypothetical protein
MDGFINERACLLKITQSLTDNPTLEKCQNVLEESRDSQSSSQLCQKSNAGRKHKLVYIFKQKH